VRLTPAGAHALCAALVAADLVARAWRIRWFCRGLGHRIGFGEALTLNAFGDAACAVTPMRFGGEPARLAGMLRARVPAPAAFVAIGHEVLAAWPVTILCAGWLAWRYAPEWWTTMGRGMLLRIAEAWPWVAAIVLVSLLAWWLARRVAHPAVRHVRRPVARVRVYWRRMPRWPVAASVVPSLVNLGSRVAILPVLALTLPDPPALGPMLLGSFALLYSQLVLPTPSGAGAVDLGFLAGAAGDLGSGDHVLLLAWRFYTSGVGVVLGLALAARLYGWTTVRRLFRGFEPR
jgi:uncharacterized membrane protein YbhN (UPF0104 family)